LGWIFVAEIVFVSAGVYVQSSPSKQSMLGVAPVPTALVAVLVRHCPMTISRTVRILVLTVTLLLSCIEIAI